MQSLTKHTNHTACVRQNIQSRLLSSSMNLTLLPLGTPHTEPHVPIYTSTNVPTCTRLIVYIGESWQDLGVLAYRTIGQESIASGSVVDLVRAIQADADSPGIIIANTGQLIWYRGGQRAVTQTTWVALPRQTAVSPQMEIDEVKNRVPGNRDAGEHVAYIFDNVIPNMARKDVKVDVIAMGDGAPEAVRYLRETWDKWDKNVQAVTLGTGFLWSEGEVGGSENFREFWGDVSPSGASPSQLNPPCSLTDYIALIARPRIYSVCRAPGHALGWTRILRLQLLLSRGGRNSGMHHAKGVQEHVEILQAR